MNKVYKIMSDRIMDMMEQGVIPWKRPWAGGLPVNLIRKYAYRGMNVINLAHTPYSLPYWVSQKDLVKLSGIEIKENASKKEYMDAVTSMSCRLLPGELYNSNIVIYTNWREDVIDKETGELKTIPFSRYYRVWNVEQTTIPQVRPDLIPEEFNRDFDPIQTAEEIIATYKDIPQITHKESRAYYRPGQDIVNMPKKNTFFSSEHYYASLFHELGHSTGHTKRLNRDMGAFFGSEKYSREELVAELTSAFLCGQARIDNSEVTENAAAYLQSWLKALKEDKNMLIWACSRAQKAADYIQGKHYQEKHEEEAEAA